MTPEGEIAVARRRGWRVHRALRIQVFTLTTLDGPIGLNGVTLCGRRFGGWVEAEAAFGGWECGDCAHFAGSGSI